MAGGQVSKQTTDPFAAVEEQIFIKTGLEVVVEERELSCLEYRIMETGGLYVAFGGMVKVRGGRLETTEEHMIIAYGQIGVIQAYLT